MALNGLIAGLRRAERQLEEQLRGIKAAIASLGGGSARGGRRGRAAGGPRKRRKLSAKARAAISRAQKLRWAKHRAAAK